MFRLLAIASLSAVVVACAGAPRGEPKDIVTVPYDPETYDQAAVDQTALAQCQAKKYRFAAPYYAQPNMNSAAWNYKTYGCY